MTHVTQTPVPKAILTPVPYGNGLPTDVPPQRAANRLRSSPPSDPLGLAVVRPATDAPALIQCSELPTSYPEVTSGHRIELGRASNYQAFRIGGAVVLTATGTTLAAIQTDFEVDSRLDCSPRFAFLYRVPTGHLPQVTREFRCSEVFQFPKDREFVFIRDADGGRRVKIEDGEAVSATLPVEGKAPQRVIGFSKLSLGDAFHMAIRQAQAERTSDPSVDRIATYTLARSGRFVGGFPGFNGYFAEVEIS
jgi:hypothetical protein